MLAVVVMITLVMKMPLCLCVSLVLHRPIPTAPHLAHWPLPHTSQEARKYVLDTDGRPLKPRSAWVDVLDSPADAPGGHAVSGGRGGRGGPPSMSEPDMEAVSLRAQPNSTSRALQQEVGGARMRITSMRRGSVSAPRMRGGLPSVDGAGENEEPWNEAQVIFCTQRFDRFSTAAAAASGGRDGDNAGELLMLTHRW